MAAAKNKDIGKLRKAHRLDFSPYLEYHVVLLKKDGNVTKEDIKTRIKAAAPQGKIPCAAAFKLAEEVGISRAEMGELLNELKIKIIQCQLGCF
jgi:hypothetical protein